MLDLAKIERIPWDEWFEHVFDWKQGQHVAILAETGGGKSTLVNHIFTKRSYGVILATKPRDETYDNYIKHHKWKRIKNWPPPKPILPWSAPPLPEHYLLWPKVERYGQLPKMTPIFRKCMESIFFDCNWALGLPDTFYLAVKMKLADIIAELQFQTRSLGVSEVNEMQRPAWIPRACWGQSTHNFLQALQDVEDLSTVRGLFRMSTKELEIVTSSLQPYEWLYHDKSKFGQLPMIIKPPPLGG